MDTVIAKWQSRSGKHTVTLYRTPHGYKYQADGAGGWLQADTDQRAIAEMATRVNEFQPDANRTPMRRVAV